VLLRESLSVTPQENHCKYRIYLTTLAVLNLKNLFHPMLTGWPWSLPVFRLTIIIIVGHNILAIGLLDRWGAVWIDSF
jgi:hypothetical protein